LLEGGVAGVFQSTRNALGEQDVIEIQIYGDEGTIYFRNSAVDELEWVRKSVDGPDLIRETLAAPVSCRYGEVEDFFDRLRGLERDGFPDLVDGYLNQEVIEAIILASEKRRTVTIQEVRPAGLIVPSVGKEGVYSSQAAWESAVGNRKFLGSAAFAYPAVDPKLPNVLLIGDSISIGYTSTVRAKLQQQANVFRIPVNGGDTGRGLEKLADWLDSIAWDAIHFNWGLHDLKYMKDGELDLSGAIVNTPEQYESNLRLLVKSLKATGAKLIWANTKPVPAESGGRVQDSEQVYNVRAAEVMMEHGIPINDLNGLVRSAAFRGALLRNVHFDEEGYSRLGDQTSECITRCLTVE
jgi:acyl-CoA thioesterase-1